jgi:hypothetical protein
MILENQFKPVFYFNPVAKLVFFIGNYFMRRDKFN